MRKTLLSAGVIAAMALGAGAVSAETFAPRVDKTPAPTVTLAQAAAPESDAAPPAAANSPSSTSSMTIDQAIGHAVVDPSGKTVGKVKNVETDAQGAPTALIVDTGKKSVAVPTTEIQVASNDKIQISKTAKDLKKLPAATSSGSGDSSAPAEKMSPGSSGSGASGGSTQY